MKMIKILSTLVLAGVTMLLTSTAANAGQLQNSKVSLSDPRAGSSSTYTYTFTATTGSVTFRAITFEYCKTPSGACTAPNGLTTTGAGKGTVTGLTDAAWTLDGATAGVPKLYHTDSGESVSASTPITVPVTTITNNSISNNANDCQNDSDGSSDTCYVRILTCAVAVGSCTSGAELDNGTVSYTVVAAVTVSARVDPTFTFVVSAIGSGTVNNGITTSVSSSFSTLPFGNLTAGTPKYAAHRVNVTTNTQAGYTVTAKMLSQMSGVYSGNNIDPFAGTGVTWGAPIGWTEPTGSTPNTNTGWIGANTTDTDVSGWSSGTQLFGPVNSTENTVMQKSSSDDGSAPVYVTYAIEANTFQPADTYSGTLVYNALPTY